MKDRKKTAYAICILVAIVLTFGLAVSYNTYGSDTLSSSEAASQIADKIIRFHVIANSDSEADQAVKLKIKDAVVSYLKETGGDFASRQEAEDFLTAHTKEIVDIAKEILKEEGFTYGVSAKMTTCYFPVKLYGDAVFPAGNYRAYRIVLGDGDGKNWWCVMYPTLCFIDTETGFLPDYAKENLERIVGSNAFSVIYPEVTNGVEDEEMSEPEVTFRFRYLTFLNDLFF